MLCACPCLNIQVKTWHSTQPSSVEESSQDTQEDAIGATLECPEIHFKGVHTTLAGLSAITIQVPSLMETLLNHDKDVKVIRCMNCQCLAYAIPVINNATSPSGWLPENQHIHLGNDMKNEQDMEHIKTMPDYSQLFKIRVYSAPSPSPNLPESLLTSFVQDIHSLYTSHVEHKKVEMERKISELRDQMMMEFERYKEKANEEKELLLSKIRTMHQDRPQESAPSSENGPVMETSMNKLEAPLLVSRRPRSLSNISHTATLTPILTTVSTFKEGPTSAKRVHFDTKLPSSRTEEPETTEDIFDLEGVDIPKRDKYVTSVSEEEEEDVRSSQTRPGARPVSPPPQLLATSLPVDIPGQLGESFDDVDADPPFIAPHILSARTYQGENTYLNPSLSKKV